MATIEKNGVELTGAYLQAANMLDEVSAVLKELEFCDTALERVGPVLTSIRYAQMRHNAKVARETVDEKKAQTKEQRRAKLEAKLAEMKAQLDALK